MDNKIQKCIIINEKNLNVIEKSLDLHMAHDSMLLEDKDVNIHDIIDARNRIKEIRKVVDQLDEVKICWG